MALKLNVKNFSLKFIDIMIGIILGLGFQWWPELNEPWQYAAFIFIYLDIVDFWIDYGPVLKRFPPKKEIDIFLDLALCFSLFLYIYSTTLDTIAYFLIAFVLFRLFDFLWFASSKAEYKPKGFDKKYVDTWMIVDVIEIAFALLMVLLVYTTTLTPLIILAVFVLVRIAMRFFASYKYKKIYLTN